MKLFCQLTLLALVALQITACGDKGSSNSNSGTTALAPQENLQSCSPQNNLNSYGRYPSPYANQYPNNPYTPYPWNTYNSNQSNFCGCPQGSIPACQPGTGIYCVPVTNSYQPAWYSYNNVNNNFSPYAGYNLNSGYNNGFNNSCGSQIGRLCQVGVLGTCGNFGTCQPTNYPYGICTN